MALNLIGEPLQPTPEGPAPYLNVQPPASHELPYYNRAAAEVADLQLDMHVDSQTAARIKVCHVHGASTRELAAYDSFNEVESLAAATCTSWAQLAKNHSMFEQVALLAVSAYLLPAMSY